MLWNVSLAACAFVVMLRPHLPVRLFSFVLSDVPISYPVCENICIAASFCVILSSQSITMHQQRKYNKSEIYYVFSEHMRVKNATH